MRDYDSLAREQSSTQSQMYAAQDSNAASQEQINRLEAAKRLVSLEESEYDRVMLNAQISSYGYYQWKGEMLEPP